MSKGDLRSFIYAHQYLYLTEDEIRKHAKSLALALVAIHGEGFLHNDVQLSSVLLHRHKSAGGYTAKLGALSHARPIGAPALAQDPNQSTLEGLNGLYKAPEVILSNGEDLSEASDVWSLGVTLYVSTCGSFPFKTSSDVINSKIDFNKTRHGVAFSEPFKNLLIGMLQVDPSSRITLS